MKCGECDKFGGGWCCHLAKFVSREAPACGYGNADGAPRQASSAVQSGKCRAELPHRRKGRK